MRIFHRNGSTDEYLISPNVINIQLDSTDSNSVIPNSPLVQTPFPLHWICPSVIYSRLFRTLATCISNYCLFPLRVRNWGFNWIIEQTGYTKKEDLATKWTFIARCCIDKMTKKKALLSVTFMFVLAYSWRLVRNSEATIQFYTHAADYVDG